MKNETPVPEESPSPILSPPVWDDWKATDRAKLWEAVALANNFNPSQFTFGSTRLQRIFSPPPPQFEELLTQAKYSIGPAGILKPIAFSSNGLEESEISLSNFVVWAKTIGYKLPSEFPWQDELLPPLTPGWPWGTHETELLRKLAAAANRFWKLYDPSDPTTAPTSKDVTDWLVKQGIAERNASVMATILRADNIKPGPRK